MKFIIYQLSRLLLWFVRLLPQKPQPIQKPARPTVIFKPVAREQAAQAQEFVRFKGKLDKQREASQWAHVTVPRHRRDLELINELKRLGKI